MTDESRVPASKLMVGPFGTHEEVMLARLQDDVLAAGVSYVCAMKVYATHLLALLEERMDGVGTFSSAEVDWLIKKLKDGSASIGGNSLEAERQRWQLWEFHDSLGEERFHSSMVRPLSATQ